jgi:acetoin utilization protein AcuB
MVAHVAEAMSGSPICVGGNATAADASGVARKRRVAHVLVLDRERLVGFLCACDLDRADPREVVAKIMKSNVVTVGPTAALEDAASLMRDRSVGCLTVVAGSLLLGVITRIDLIRAGLGVDRVARPCRSCGMLDEMLHDGPEDRRCVAFCRECLDCSGRADRAG